MNSLNIAGVLEGPRESLESKVAALEGLPYALAYANASAALHTLSKLLFKGERVLIDEQAPPLLDSWNAMGLAVERVNLLELNLEERSWRGVKLVWASRITPELLEGARVQGALVLLDSTLEPGRGALGADLVYYGHSAALSGHFDLSPALLATASQSLFEALSIGRIPPGTIESLLAVSGMSTLSLRLERSRATADLLFVSLERHPAILSMQKVGSGVLRLELRDTANYAALYNLTLFTGMQLGATESAYQLRGDHALLSVGIEEPKALLGDLIAALANYGSSTHIQGIHNQGTPLESTVGRTLGRVEERGEGRIVTPPTGSRKIEDALTEHDAPFYAPAPAYAPINPPALENLSSSQLDGDPEPSLEPLHVGPTIGTVGNGGTDALEPENAYVRPLRGATRTEPVPTAQRQPREESRGQGARGQGARGQGSRGQGARASRQEAPLVEPSSSEAHLEQQGAPQGFEPAKQDPTENLSELELRRYNRLRDWRNEEAKKLSLSRFIIASNATLAEIAKREPQTLEQLVTAKGMGEQRVAKYGAAMLEVLGTMSNER